jgi:hypothetical protein
MGYYKGIKILPGETHQQTLDRYERSKKITRAIWEKYYGVNGIFTSKKKGIIIRETKGGEKEIVKGDDAIQELLKQKEAAKGDKDLCRKIRSKLRKLGYRKRNQSTQEEEKEEPPERKLVSTTEMIKRIKSDKRKKKRELKKRKGR